MTSSPPSCPAVAVVLCAHNGAVWIEEQIRSLLFQTFPVAIRVFDDASTDATKEVVSRFTSENDVVYCRNDVALGVVENFSTGIKTALAEGFQYIALADQDDIWSTRRIEKGMEIIQKAEISSAGDSAHLVHSDLIMVNAHNQEMHPSFVQWRRYGTSGKKDLPAILGRNGVMGNTILMNRSLASQSLPFPPQLHVHDYWLALVAELIGQRHYIEEPLVRYRIHKNNTSNSSETVAFGVEREFNGWSLSRLLTRNFRLPFKEDSRQESVEFILKDPRFKQIDSHQKETVRNFLKYLNFSENRLKLALMMLNGGYLRRGFRHRVRVFVGILTTQRYQRRL